MKDFEVLVLDGAYPSSVAMSRDILDAASTFAPAAGAPRPTWGMYSLNGGRVHLRDGISIETAKLPPRRSGLRSVCVIPGLGAEPRTLLARMKEPECVMLARRLAAHVDAGGSVAASCSAVFLLDAAGLLAQRRATTTWWLAATLAQISPACTVDADRMVCADGPIVTAGAAFAHADLLLHLIRDRFGPKLSEAIARYLLLDHRHFQSAYVIPEVLAGGHALVQQLTARIESALPHAPSITQLARELCVSERTLARHVRHATGNSPRSLIQSIRMRRARDLLQNSRMPMEQVAAAVGYADTTALRRLLRRTTGQSPATFRSSRSVAR